MSETLFSMYSHTHDLHPHVKTGEKRRLVYHIDHNLHYLYQMPVYPSGSELVFLVEKNHQPYLLKVELNEGHPLKPTAPSSRSDWGVREEREVLAALRGVKGVAHLKRWYETAEGVALLKEFYLGASSHKLLDSDSYLSFRAIISDIHAAGVANLGLKRKNIIIQQDDKSPVLLALGGGILMDSLEDPGKALEYKHNDLASLRKLFSARTRYRP
jgi:hypothetical protein